MLKRTYKYFGSKIENRCEYCHYGKISADKNSVLCSKKGIVDLDYKCRKYIYSPLRRLPKREPSLFGRQDQYKPEDFEL